MGLAKLFKSDATDAAATVSQSIHELSSHHHHRNNSSLTIFAGKIWPELRKLYIDQEKATAIADNVVSITHWQDLVFLLFLSFAFVPLVIFVSQRFSRNKENTRGFTVRKRYHIAHFLSSLARVVLSSFFVDIICIALKTIGYDFPDIYDLPCLYTKIAFTVWALRRFLEYKRMALIKMMPSKTDSLGRIEVFDRLINGVSITLVTLLLFDWLSLQFGSAMKGVFAFGSVGTLAVTLGSQDMLSQLLSGFFLTTSNKVNPGDSVQFGDGTSGTILKLGWMDTLIRNGDNSVTCIPNSLLARQKVKNLSRVRTSQVKQTLRFHYQDADEIPALLETIKTEVAKSCDHLIDDDVWAFWTNYNEDHLEVEISTQHNIPPLDDAYWVTRQKMLEAINRAVKKHGLQFAHSKFLSSLEEVRKSALKREKSNHSEEQDDSATESSVSGN